MIDLESVVLTINVIIMAIGISMFIAMAILQIGDYPYHHKLNKRYVVTGIIGLIIFFISLPVFIRSLKIYYSPELSHERLLKGLDKAEKELQKFYIDYPEFKENKE